MLRRLVEARLFMPPADASYEASERRLGSLYVSTLVVPGLDERVACATTFDPSARHYGKRSARDGTPDTVDDTPLVIYFHGNAEDIGMAAPRMSRLASSLGVDAMIVEYPGYGPLMPDTARSGSPRPERPWTAASTTVRPSALAQRALPSEQSAHAAARVAFMHAIRQRWVSKSGRIVLWGTSLGGAAAARLAADMSRCGRPPGALIMASTFATARDAARDLIGGPWWRAVGRNVFATADHVPDVSCPTLLLHGDADEVIPARHARILASACAPETWWRMAIVTGGTHNNIDDDGFVVPQVRAFLCETMGFPDRVVLRK